MEGGDGGGEKQGDTGEKRDIRRPMNAFLIFCKRHRSMVREKHPDRDNRSVTRILGDLWANLPDEEKAVYTNLAKTYKDAFMKANPDYKWHSTDRLPQPAKMATRPTNVRPPRSLSASDAPPLGHSDGDKMGGVNLLLLAGKQSMPVGDLQTSHTLENQLASADLMGANSALLQLAEMCSSSELAGGQVDPAVLRKAPPKKRARHWSHSDALHNEVTDQSNLTATPLLLQNMSHISKSLPAPTATQTSQLEMATQKQDLTFQPTAQSTVIVQRKETEQYCTFKPINICNQMASVRNVSPLLKGEKDVHSETVGIIPWSETFNMDVGMPPKKKFTKLHDRYKGDRQTAATTSTSTESGCLSDQNDNAIFTCGKLVVDHIIDRLLTSSEHSESVSPSSTDIEKVRKIIAADITEREKSRGPSNKDMGKLLSEVVQKPQNLVEKVIEEAYNMDLKWRAKQDLPSSSDSCLRPVSVDKLESKVAVHMPTVSGKVDKFFKLDPIPEQTGQVQASLEVKHDMATLVTTASLSPFQVSSNGETAHGASKYTPLPSAPAKEEREERDVEEMMGDPSKEDGGDYMQDEDEGYSQPVRKSRRRNRGQRYQELINEGIIQPSKERLAARRHEQVPVPVPGAMSSSLFMVEDVAEEDHAVSERPRQSLKRSNSEVDPAAPDEKRYRTGDFDLEAEIATLPPCSLDQVPRRRGPRKRSDSESGRRPPLSPTECQMKEESNSPEPAQGLTSLSSSSVSQHAVSTEPLTGSQKRKARKHSISRLVASKDSGSKAKPPGIEASIPMVRDATISPVRSSQSQPSTSTCESLAIATSALTTYASASVDTVKSYLTLLEEKCVPDSKKELPQESSLQQGQMKDIVITVDKMLKSEKKLTAEKECCVEERKTFTTEQKLLGSVDITQTTTGCSADVEKRDVMKNSSILETAGMDENCWKEKNKIPATKLKTDSLSDEAGLKEKMTAMATEVNSCVETQHPISTTVIKQDRNISLPFTGDVVKTFNQGFTDSMALTEIRSDGSGMDISQGSVCLSYGPSLEGRGISENSVRENGGEIQTKRRLLKEMLSSDSGQCSSQELEDVERETREEDQPGVFLSETSGLMCVAQTDPLYSQHLSTLVVDKSESEFISQSGKKGLESACEGNDQKQGIVTTGLTCVEDQEDAALEDCGSRLTIAVDSEDLLDGGQDSEMTTSLESVSKAQVEFSPFSGTATTTGPRVTTVTMTTTDAMPTALSLEMMEEEGMVDSGMGNPMLCGSPMPESPSMTAVHS
ncbi:uncharacterized protein LOC143291692 isoform X2 [Babylonia areolata]|uniref:uncharacterized protein LOC143291692 isoform X2 n=1 Tax=Babylonia areolata TaxID=304850 RepID=UPI003FD2C848